MSSGRSTILFLLFFGAIATAGCFGDGKVVVLQRPEGAETWERTFKGEPSVRIFHEWRFMARGGHAVDGFMETDPEARDTRFYVSPETGEMAYAARSDKESHRWGPAPDHLFGLTLIGTPLREGMVGHQRHGDWNATWKIEQIQDDVVMLNLTMDGLPGVYSHLKLIDGRAIASELIRHGPTGAFTTTIEHAPLTDEPPVFPQLPEIPPPILVPVTDGIQDPFAGPVPFEEVWQLWQNDERYSQAQEWWVKHPQSTFAWVTFAIVDENDGNATVYRWEAEYQEGDERLRVEAGYRFTHPTEEMNLAYPLYDACPEGCLGPYSTGAVPGRAEPPLDLSESPGLVLSADSAVARTQALDVGEAFAVTWSKIEGRGESARALREPVLTVNLQQPESRWDPEPQLGAPGGRFASMSQTLSRYVTFEWASGDFAAVQSDRRLF